MVPRLCVLSTRAAQTASDWSITKYSDRVPLDRFVAWGFLHGFFIVLEGAFLNRWLQAIRPLRHIYTLTALLLTWLVFRAPSFEYAFEFVGLLFGHVQNQIP